MKEENSFCSLAKNGPKRFILGSVIAAAGLFLATCQHPALWIPTVLLGAPFGGIGCCDPGKREEAILTSSIALLAMSLIVWVVVSQPAAPRDWWRLSLVSIPIAFLGGTGIGSLIGFLWRKDGDADS